MNQTFVDGILTDNAPVIPKDLLTWVADNTQLSRREKDLLQKLYGYLKEEPNP